MAKEGESAFLDACGVFEPNKVLVVVFYICIIFALSSKSSVSVMRLLNCFFSMFDFHLL